MIYIREAPFEIYNLGVGDKSCILRSLLLEASELDIDNAKAFDLLTYILFTC